MAKIDKTKRKVTTKEDVAYIVKYAHVKSDYEIAKELGGSVPWVRKIRKENNIKKHVSPKDKELGMTKEKHDNIIEKMSKGDMTVVNDLANSNEEDSLKVFYEGLFRNTKQFDLLKQMYTETEIEFYLQEFTTYVSDIRRSGGTINAIELRNLDQLIQTNLRMMRLVADEKMARDAIEKMREEADNDLEKLDPEKIPLYEILTKKAEDIHKAWSGLADRSVAYLKMLNVTRQDRLKRSQDVENGVLNVIQSLQDKDENRVIEEQAALLKASSKKVENKFREAGFLMDSESIKNGDSG